MTSAILIPILGEKIALDCILLADELLLMMTCFQTAPAANRG